MTAMDLMRDGVSLNQFEDDQRGGGDGGSSSRSWADVSANQMANQTASQAAQPTTAQPTTAQPTTAQPTMVLQPSYLTGVEGSVFQAAFAQALQQASVILVDLIWLDQIDRDGLDVLLDVMKRADDQSKTVSFLSMDAATRQWLDEQWEQENTPLAVGRNDLFAPDFEKFLANYQARKEVTLLAVEIASTRQW
jgi:anti-anti-sigma regulatory factor